MSSYVWAQLEAGTYGLPGPAVVTSPWVLEVRVPRPRWRGFTRVVRPEQWSRMRTARQMVADYSDPWDVLVVSAKRPGQVDADGLRNLVPGASQAGGVHWQIGSVFQGPTAQAFYDQVHHAGRLLLLTGDLQAHWSAVHAGRRASFTEMFPDGAWVGLCATVLLALGLTTVVQSRRKRDQVRQQAERRSEARYRALIDRATDLVLVTDRTGTARFLSPSAERLLTASGPSTDRLGSCQDSVPVDLLAAVAATDQAVLAAALHQSTDGTSSTVEVGITTGAGVRTFEMSVQDLTDTPAVGGLLLTGHDITDRRAMQTEMEHRALHDTLTGLPNRALLADRFEQALSARSTGRPVFLPDRAGRRSQATAQLSVSRSDVPALGRLRSQLTGCIVVRILRLCVSKSVPDGVVKASTDCRSGLLPVPMGVARTEQDPTCQPTPRRTARPATERTAMPNNQDTERLVRGYVAAIDSRDLERVWAHYDDDIVYEDTAVQQIYRGIEATKKFYTVSMSALDVRWQVDTIHATDEGFGVSWVMTGKHVHDLPGMPATNREFTVPGASIAEVRNDKIVHNRDFWNHHTLLKQLGLL